MAPAPQRAKQQVVIASGSQRIRLEVRPDFALGWITILTPTDASACRAETVGQAVASIRPSIHNQLLRTAVLTELDAGPFLAHGFTVALRLQVLTHDLKGIRRRRSAARVPWRTVATLATGQRVTVRRMRMVDLDRVLAVDQAAFAAIGGIADGALARGWMDRHPFDDAIAATPHIRATVAVAGETIVGFAISGRAKRHGYLQRLAVAPEAQGRGVGSALITDCLEWSKRRRVSRVAVNTQHGNTAALNRYLALGFAEVSPGLVICERLIGGSAA
jgi:ribosomal protein S18 acetylase RimI-like enzyme